MRTFAYIAKSCSLAILVCASTLPAAAYQSSEAGSAQDKQFVMKASEGSLAEVELGKLALKKSQNPDVKQFAQKMVVDHSKLISDMKPCADQLGVKPPTKLDAKHQQLADHLKSLSGDEFDKEYIKAMVADHHHDLGEFIAEQSKASDPTLKETVTKGTEVIREHTQMIDEIAKKNGLPTPPMAS
ncbi:DUF4142 domain-containing protein [Edaphobacter sp. HDX4]|uniref:DUF4142 domain-containing protein n=1 Tax=Edaphobacter sp. HDX4 TaxID=2794064 RepID=UPI002FE5D063